MIQLTQIDGNILNLDNLSPEAQAHFNNDRNYAHFILDEWKTQPYQEYLSKEDKVILDIGANVGLFALHVMPYVERIICVEPTESHMVIQKQLLSMFPVEHEQAALHNYTGKVGFHIEPVNTTMNRVNVSHAGAIEVDCITLYDLCKKYNLSHVDFCKIDIEGSEDLAVTVETVRPIHSIIDKIMIELHPRSEEMQKKYVTIFEEAGYKAKAIDFNGTVYVYK